MEPVLVFLLLCALCPAFAAAGNVSLTSADAAYAQRENLDEARTALELYAKAAQDDPASIEPCWKAARTAWWLGDHADSRAEKIRVFQKGIDFAQTGLARDPQSVECHFWLGCDLGAYGEAKGIMKSLM